MLKVRIIAEVKVKQASKEQLLPGVDALLEGSRSEAGNKRYDFTENIDCPGHFFVIEEWVSEKATEEHCASPHVNNFLTATEGKTEKNQHC